MSLLCDTNLLKYSVCSKHATLKLKDEIKDKTAYTCRGGGDIYYASM